MYLCLGLDVWTHTRSAVVGDAAEIAVLHASKLDGAAADRVEALTSPTVDAHRISVLVEFRVVN